MIKQPQPKSTDPKPESPLWTMQVVPPQHARLARQYFISLAQHDQEWAETVKDDSVWLAQACENSRQWVKRILSTPLRHYARAEMSYSYYRATATVGVYHLDRPAFDLWQSFGIPAEELHD